MPKKSIIGKSITPEIYAIKKAIIKSKL